MLAGIGAKYKLNKRKNFTNERDGCLQFQAFVPQRSLLDFDALRNNTKHTPNTHTPNTHQKKVSCNKLLALHGIMQQPFFT